MTIQPAQISRGNTGLIKATFPNGIEVTIYPNGAGTIQPVIGQPSWFTKDNADEILADYTLPGLADLLGSIKDKPQFRPTGASIRSTPSFKSTVASIRMIKQNEASVKWGRRLGYGTMIDLTAFGNGEKE